MPKNLTILDIKPKNKLILDVKPKVSLSGDLIQVYTEQRTILKGQPMGLLLAITYPEDIINFTATRP